MQFADYQYSLSQVTAIAIDTTSPTASYLWVAFARNAAGNCYLKKVSANNPSQVYYTVSVPVFSINAMVVVNGYIFLAVTPNASGTYSNAFSFAYSVTNPLTTSSYINFPVGIEESPIALTIGTSNVYFLTPGIESGTYSTIVSTDQTNVWVENIVLDQSGIDVNNAVGITVDASSNIWVVTGESPSNLIRIFGVSGGWDFEKTELS